MINDYSLTLFVFFTFGNCRVGFLHNISWNVVVVS